MAPAMKNISILAVLVAATTSSIARAEDAKWGTPEQSAVCTEDCDYHASWKNTTKAECVAEIDRRTKACVADPKKKAEYDAWVKSYRDAKSTQKLQSL